MLSYLKNRMMAYGHLAELDVDLMAMRACTLGWDITVIANMPQKGITMKMQEFTLDSCWPSKQTGS